MSTSKIIGLIAGVALTGWGIKNIAGATSINGDVLVGGVLTVAGIYIIRETLKK